MGTLITNVLDMALVTIQDYRIDKLYTTSPQNWFNYLMGFVKNAIPYFTNCKKSLVYVEELDWQQSYFISILTPMEMSILANWIVYVWLTREIDNITQIKWQLNDNDYKHYSEAENLKQKSEYQDKIREKVVQQMVDYGMMNINWENWYAGNYRV